MSSRIDDLRDLARMLDEGKITQVEYEVVKTEILEAPADEWGEPTPPLETAEPGEGIETPDVPTDDSSQPPDWISFAKEIPPLYWSAVGASILTVFFAGSFTPIAWVAVAVSVTALVRVKSRQMRWMAWTGLIVGGVFSAIAVLGGGTAGTVDAGPLPPTQALQQLDEVPVGSLGVRFGDMTEGWNALPDPPHVLRGFSTNPEPGPLDSFIHTFDSGAILAGAYNPADQYVYALMSKVNLADPDLPNFYVHLCYLLYPGTNECFEAYVEESNVFGKTPDELASADHSASYRFDGNEWRIEVTGDVLTLRVLGPQQEG